MMPAEQLARAISHVTVAMLGKTFQAGGPIMPPRPWRTAILPIPGARPITIALSSDHNGCAELASAMLGMEVSTLAPAMIDDFLRELLNMTAGQLKRELALDQALGLPRVVDGVLLFGDPSSWTHCVLDSGSIPLVVSLVEAIY
jgi:hypothetical protein